MGNEKLVTKLTKDFGLNDDQIMNLINILTSGKPEET